MSPKLKPLLLPQLVEERRKHESQQTSPDCDFTYVYYTANSSSSDVGSPITPTFTPSKGHFRLSSSVSSLDLPPQQPVQESPVSPTPSNPGSKTTTKTPLPDVQEEPIEPVDSAPAQDEPSMHDRYGLYSCLCDEPCEHRNSSEDIMFHANANDYDLDYELGFLSDGDDVRYPRQKKFGTESPFSGLTSRIGSRLPSMTRWKSPRRGHPVLSPSTEMSLESVVLSGAPSSRSSSMSAPNGPGLDRSFDQSMIATPALSFFESTESINLPAAPVDIEPMGADRASLEREREMATTPLLPPLMTSPLCPPPPESPLQSPTVALSPVIPSPVVPDVQMLPSAASPLPRPSLSTRPSISSFGLGANGASLSISMPALLQEHDEWSDRLGHANFTITPVPYESDSVTLEALRQLRADWDAARCNYTKHLVRTGENYGETSKIYALTEAKWAETERRWRSSHDGLMEQIVAVSSTPTTPTSRSCSRGRARASSGGAALATRAPVDDVFAGMQWRRLEDGLPSAIPRLVDAEGKFPARGDEDIVGPMQRDEVMLRTHSEERKGARFWRNLAGKVGLRK